MSASTVGWLLLAAMVVGLGAVVAAVRLGRQQQRLGGFVAAILGASVIGIALGNGIGIAALDVRGVLQARDDVTRLVFWLATCGWVAAALVWAVVGLSCCLGARAVVRQWLVAGAAAGLVAGRVVLLALPLSYLDHGVNARWPVLILIALVTGLAAGALGHLLPPGARRIVGSALVVCAVGLAAYSLVR